MKTLEDLFFGNNIPFQLPAIDRENYRCLIDQYEKIDKPFRESMTEEQEKLYEESMNAYQDLVSSNLRDAFIRGFRMGARVMLEVLGDERSTVGE